MKKSMIIAVVLMAGACASGDTASTTSEPSDETSTTASSTSVPPTSAPSTVATTTSTTTSSSTTTSTTTTPTTLPGGELTRCTSPEGYSISYPQSWSTNTGDVVPTCGQFDPASFAVPEGTDERVAAITAYIDQVSFVEATAPEEDRDADRAVTTVDGLHAVRLQFEASGEGLWPEGTPITTYAIDLDPGPDEGSRTMFVDTIGTQPFDYARNQVVLDRMVRTLDVEMEDVPDDPGLVTRYQGGGGGFSVEGEFVDGEACLRIPPNGEPVCVTPPGPEGLAPIELVDLRPIQAGVTGDEVFSVEVQMTDGEENTHLPAPIPDSSVRGFALTASPEDVEAFTLRNVTGDEIDTVEAGD